MDTGIHGQQDLLPVVAGELAIFRLDGRVELLMAATDFPHDYIVAPQVCCDCIQFLSGGACKPSILADGGLGCSAGSGLLQDVRVRSSAVNTMETLCRKRVVEDGGWKLFDQIPVEA